MRQFNKEVIYGIYSDEEDLLRAVRNARSKHLEIMDVYTPFPVHGLDQAMGLSESRLHQAGFIYGALGTLTAFLGMSWIFTRDWPIIFGGKPYWPVPSFIPITFELTVLFAAWGMTITFYTICGLWPGVTNPQLDLRTTDDKFCLAFDRADVPEGVAQSFFSETGADEVNSKTI
ncbi:MAG: DUF3341 domain-containing protein [Saprospiraceae bacterium]|nr:DUF3341 domain-containing protein [Candidatus Vicinibacter affinis]MBP6172290.1 DUF3341 domain-containing protein [Saprospiraceae bacterium]MBK6572013.1 DUF3341 domain-containing protein [Candidatus Vicinibacter affinis]MBK6823988.1 DUF3341 domain-containing protein [Candidatus Vicinibacter affinis]MBK7305201.1 DUF3341 domain-containing protein [Candidatus Vicinibacter affinis]